MTRVASPQPEVIAVVDLEYARDFNHWIGTVRRLSALPEDPTLFVQIRAKSLCREKREIAARVAREAFQNRYITLIWNGAPDIAASCGYDGCHQPQADIGELDDKSSHLIHSASVHDEASLQRAQSCGVDFVICGPVFEPHWKRVPALGIDGLRRLITLADVPLVAIGGINGHSISGVSHSGASGVAVVSSVMDSSDPIGTVIELQTQWRNFVNVKRSG